MNKQETISWLRETDASRLDALWRRADALRRERVGDAVHLRGLVEISNACARSCGYCGIRADNAKLERYRMTAEEILGCARQAVAFGYGTVVLQAGEDYGLTREWVADVVGRIKADTPLAVTLSLGERPDADLALWREAGADRYLLRFETSNRALYDRIHPPLDGRPSDRFAILRRLRDLGYEIGSGVMIGIPGQTCDDLAADVEAFRELDLDMIGVGPYIPHPDTPLGSGVKGSDAISGRMEMGSDPLVTNGKKLPGGHAGPPLRAAADQAPNTELMTYKMVALARLACPGANIPSTTALATLNRDAGRELGLQRGANVVMPNLTPVPYRALYEIYPAKACVFETADQCHGCLIRRIRSIGRTLGAGRGDSRRLINV